MTWLQKLLNGAAKPMRILEITLAVVLFLHLALPLVLQRRFRPLALIASGVLVVHLFVEGYRWQMIPLYALTFLLMALAVISWMRYPSTQSNQNKSNGIQAFFAVTGCVLVIIAAALPAVFPIPNLPQPTGPYPIGVFSTMLVDNSRKELYSGNPDEPRRIMIQVWYPAAPAADAKVGVWMENVEVIGPSISKWLDFPPFFLDHVKYGRSHSYPNAPLLPGQNKFPVITFSHGWNGVRVQSTFLMEELASQGYVVVSIDHTYGARMVVFPDGTIAENNPNALPTNQPLEILVPAAQKLVNQWAGDIGFTLDTLTAWNQNDPTGRFTNRLDLEKVGVSGHSTGGGAAIEFCGRDPRCKAGVGLDPYLTPVSDQVLDGKLSQPFLLLFSEVFPTERNTMLLGRLMKNAQAAREISIMGTAHYDFSDLPLLTPLAPYLGLKGPLAAERVLQINREFSLALFNQVLSKGSGTILAGPSNQYPELRFDYLP